MKKPFQSILLLTAGAIAGIFLIMQLSFDEKDELIKEQISNEDKNVWIAPRVPDQIDFAGENVPLERWDVYERFDRELLYNYYYQNNIIYIMKLANRYFPVIEERLKANGVPDDFKYLCIAESNLQNLTSRAGAVGFWQFMPESAPEYNLNVNSLVDERYDYIKSTDAACLYLKQAYQKFGSWTAAAASYNCGQGGYNGQATFQGSKNYYDLLLPEETNKYIFRILAFKHILTNAETFGFNIEEDNLYNPLNTKQVIVTSSIPNLATWSQSQGTSYKIVKLLNPWLRGRSLPVKTGTEYKVLIPAQ
jgi:hypothetical protein